MHIAASQCGPSLRIINARVDEHALEEIKSICRASPNLRDLRLRFKSGQVRIDDVILTAVRYCSLIEVLPTLCTIMTDVSMNALGTIHTLREFTLTCNDCTSTAIQRVLQFNPHLTLLLIYIKDFDDALFRCIGRYCRNLKSLKLRKLTLPAPSDNLLQDIYRACPQLEVVEVRMLRGNSTETLQVLFESCHNLARLDIRMHESVNPDDEDDEDELSTITEQAQPAGEPVLFAPYPTLTRLYVWNGDAVDRDLSSIFTYCTNLREVHLEYCINVTVETIKMLSQSCPRLNTFRLDRCKNICIAVMLQVATELPSNLTTLELSGMPVNDEVLIQLSLRCRSLTCLHMFRCEDGPITETGILAVIETCPDLASINVNAFKVPYPLFTPDFTNLRQLYPLIKFDNRYD